MSTLPRLIVVLIGAFLVVMGAGYQFFGLRLQDPTGTYGVDVGFGALVSQNVGYGCAFIGLVLMLIAYRTPKRGHSGRRSRRLG